PAGAARPTGGGVPRRWRAARAEVGCRTRRAPPRKPRIARRRRRGSTSGRGPGSTSWRLPAAALEQRAFEIEDDGLAGEPALVVAPQEVHVGEDADLLQPEHELGGGVLRPRHAGKVEHEPA